MKVTATQLSMGSEESLIRAFCDEVAQKLYRFLANSHRVNLHEIELTVKL